MTARGSRSSREQYGRVVLPLGLPAPLHPGQTERLDGLSEQNSSALTPSKLEGEEIQSTQDLGAPAKG